MDDNTDSIERARNVLKYGMNFRQISFSICVFNLLIVCFQSVLILLIILVAGRYPSNRELQELTKQNLKKNRNRSTHFEHSIYEAEYV